MTPRELAPPTRCYPHSAISEGVGTRRYRTWQDSTRRSSTILERHVILVIMYNMVCIAAPVADFCMRSYICLSRI
jgi:hypothetical protein